MQGRTLISTCQWRAPGIHEVFKSCKKPESDQNGNLLPVIFLSPERHTSPMLPVCPGFQLLGVNSWPLCRADKNQLTHFRFHQSQSKLGFGAHTERQRVLTSNIYICSLEISNKSTFKCCRSVSTSHHCHWKFHPNEEWSTGPNSHQKSYFSFQKIQRAWWA